MSLNMLSNLVKNKLKQAYDRIKFLHWSGWKRCATCFLKLLSTLKYSFNHCVYKAVQVLLFFVCVTGDTLLYIKTFISIR